MYICSFSLPSSFSNTHDKSFFCTSKKYVDKKKLVFCLDAALINWKQQYQSKQSRFLQNLLIDLFENNDLIEVYQS